MPNTTLSTSEDARRALPSVDQVLNWPVIGELVAAHGRTFTKQTISSELEQLRQQELACEPDQFAYNVQGRLLELLAPSLRKVFNLTGTVLHTNLGRAPLPEEAITAMLPAAPATWNSTCTRASAVTATVMSKTGSAASPAPKPLPWSITTPPPYC